MSEPRLNSLVETQESRYKVTPIVTYTIAVGLVVVFFVDPSFSCENDWWFVLRRNVTHVDTVHLMANIISLIQLRTIEERLGHSYVMMLLILFLVSNTILQQILRSWTAVTCAVGFSGVIFSLLAWEMVTTSSQLSSVLMVVLFETIANSLHPQVSTSSHLLGALIGTVSGLIARQIGV